MREWKFDGWNKRKSCVCHLRRGDNLKKEANESTERGCIDDKE